MRGPSTCRLARSGFDLAKNVFQVHGVDAAGKVVITKQLRRGQVLEFFEKLPPCLIGMEACATSHHWARELDEARARRAADAGELRQGLRQAHARTMRPMRLRSARR